MANSTDTRACATALQDWSDGLVTLGIAEIRTNTKYMQFLNKRQHKNG